MPDAACVTANLPIHAPAELPEGKRLHPALPYTEAQIVRAVRQEMAVTLEDVLARRTRALFLNARAAMEMAPEVAEIMAREAASPAGWAQRQVESFEETARGYLPRA